MGEPRAIRVEDAAGGIRLIFDRPVTEAWLPVSYAEYCKALQALPRVEAPALRPVGGADA